MRSDRGDSAQRCEQKKTARGGGRGESEGTPAVLFQQKLPPVYQILVYPMIGRKKAWWSDSK